MTPVRYGKVALSDEREARVVTNGEFFESHKGQLRELFVALGRENKWSDDARQLETYISKRWIGNEHGHSTQKDVFTLDQEERARKILKGLGFFDEVLPPENAHYEQAVIVGATMSANLRRYALLERLRQKHGIRIDNTILFAGQRLRNARDGTVDEFLSTEGRLPGNDISKNEWVKEQLGLPWEGLEWENAFATETELGILAMLKAVEDAELAMPTEIRMAEHGSSDPTTDIPARKYATVHYKIKCRDFTVLNGTAVQRGEGTPRHTTASCTKEWLELLPPRLGARVLFVSGNPHTLRTAMTTYEVIRNLGREDIQLDICGTSMPEGLPMIWALGEIAALILNDIRRNY